MTNSKIIADRAEALADAGIIRRTGAPVTVIYADGTEAKIQLPEAIHTYQKWRDLGFQVRRGEKAVDSFPVWKYRAGKEAAEDADGEKEKGRLFMRKAAFFAASQVDKAEVVAATINSR